MLLPLDPDASARALRRRLHELTGRVVGVVVTDTAGRAWREGQTDIAVGAAGLQRGRRASPGGPTRYGNPLVVTAPAVADELAGAAELAQGKLGGRPFAVVRGRADLVLPADDDGPGAVALVRPDGADLFGYGAREAVLRALAAEPGDAAPSTARPAGADELAAVHRRRARRRRDARSATATWSSTAARRAHGVGGRRGGVRARLGGRRAHRIRRRRSPAFAHLLRRLCRRSDRTSHPLSTARTPHVAKQAKTDRQAVIETDPLPAEERGATARPDDRRRVRGRRAC